jgi:hypothetical protein
MDEDSNLNDFICWSSHGQTLHLKLHTDNGHCNLSICVAVHQVRGEGGKLQLFDFQLLTSALGVFQDWVLDFSYTKDLNCKELKL